MKVKTTKNNGLKNSKGLNLSRLKKKKKKKFDWELTVCVRAKGEYQKTRNLAYSVKKCNISVSYKQIY